MTPVVTTDSTSVQTNWVFIPPIQITGQIVSDRTGRFPINSSRGNIYIMVVYDFDLNTILAEPIKSCTEIELV